MLFKILFIIMFLVLRIDRSFQATQFKCSKDEDCVMIVFDENLYSGIIPIFVTENVTPDIDVAIESHLNGTQSVPKYLRVDRRYGQGTITAIYLYGKQQPIYPFVAIMNDHRVLSPMVIGYNAIKLDDLFSKAQNADETEYIDGYTTFSYDMINRISKRKIKFERINQDIKDWAKQSARLLNKPVDVLQPTNIAKWQDTYENDLVIPTSPPLPSPTGFKKQSYHKRSGGTSESSSAKKQKK